MIYGYEYGVKSFDASLFGGARKEIIYAQNKKELEEVFYNDD